MKYPILIRNILHLTDARYFAAMGVDWMSMRLHADPVSFSRWHTFRDWIEGVKLAAEVDVRDEELLARTIIDAQPDGLIPVPYGKTNLPDGVQMVCEIQEEDIQQISGDPLVILSWSFTRHWEEVLKGYNAQRVFLEARWTEERLKEVLGSGYAGGFCFEGGEESELGMRDYEVMDTMLSFLGRGD